MLHGNLANVFWKRGDYPLARKAYLQALGLQEELVQRAPEDLRYKSNLAMTYNNLAFVTNDAREKEALFRKALETRKHLVEREPPDAMFRRNLARTYQNLGGAQETLGETNDGLRSFQESCRLLQQVVVEAPALTVYQAGAVAPVPCDRAGFQRFSTPRWLELAMPVLEMT